MTSDSDKPVVVLLHGLARTHRMMSRLAAHLGDAGYETWAKTYLSRKHDLPTLVRWVEDQLRADLGHRPLFAVTHSLGGILVRHLSDLPWRGAVLVAPPNHGSIAAMTFRQSAFLAAFWGKVAPSLADSRGWPPPPKPFAVIAGTRAVSITNPPSLGTRLLRVFPDDAPNDGTVMVSETRLEGMADFATVDANHTWIMRHPATLAMVLNFLERGTLT